MLESRKDLDLNLSNSLLLRGAVARRHALRISQTLADSLGMLVHSQDGTYLRRELVDSVGLNSVNGKTVVRVDRGKAARDSR